MEAIVTVFTGDTFRIIGSFRGLATPPAVGPLVDPDDEEATVTVYNAEEVKIFEDVASKDVVGVYIYDYTAPIEEGQILVEVKGLLDGKPQLCRVKLDARFKPR